LIKKLLAVAVVAAVAKIVLDKLTKGGKDADLWAEATDSVH
jgi:hypothetical protein